MRNQQPITNIDAEQGPSVTVLNSETGFYRKPYALYFFMMSENCREIPFF